MELRIKRAPRIDIEIAVPGDKSISHRAVIIAALSNGVCTLRGFLPSEDCMHTVNAMRALGIRIEHPEPTTLIVHGKRRVLTAPKEEINCGNSGKPDCRDGQWIVSSRPFLRWVPALWPKGRTKHRRSAFGAARCAGLVIARLWQAHR